MSDLDVVTNEAAYHLEKIQNLFKTGARITVVVRNPYNPGDAGFLLTDDDLDAVIEEIKKRQQKGIAA